MLPIAQLFNWRITHLVEELTENNSIFTLKELGSLTMIYGEDAKIIIISTLLDEIDFRSYRTADAIKLSNLKEELLSAIVKANASTTICRAFEGGKRQAMLQMGSKLPEDTFENIIGMLNLSINQSIMLAYCVLQSQYPSVVQLGLRILSSRLPSVTDLQEIPDDILQGLRLLCHNNRELSNPDVSVKFLALLYTLKRQTPGLSMSTYQSTALDMDAVQSAALTATQKTSIAAMLSDYGCQCSQTLPAFRAVFDEIVAKIPIDEEQIAKVMTMVIQPQALEIIQMYNLLQNNDGDESKIKAKTMWNLDVIADALSATCRFNTTLDWNIVVKYLDQPNLKIKSEQDFLALVKLFIRVSGKPMSAVGLMGLWENRSAQLALLVLGANLPRNLVDFSSLCTADNKLEGDPPMPPNLSWVSLYMYCTLMELASRGLGREVLDALVSAAANYPEYVTIGLAQVQDPSSGVRSDVLRRTLPLFTALPGSRPTSIAIMKKLLDTNQDLLVILFRISLKRATTMQNILEVDARLKSIGAVGRRVDEEGVIDELIGYWCVLSDRGEINLEEKLSVVLSRNQQQARFLIGFAKMHSETLRSRSADGGLLSYESCATILRLAQQHPLFVPIEEIRNLAAYLNQHMHSQIQQQQQQQQSQQLQQQQIPALHQGMSHSGHASGPDNSMQQEGSGRLHGGNESFEVEEEANSYFQKIYTSDISISDVILLLKRFKSSADTRETEIFRCMIHNLFDEYRFFHKYPDKELQVTGRLFGSLIQHQLVSSITLGIALRYVLEALRKDPEQAGSNEKMFRFGKMALDQFRSRLGEWPQYCSHLVQIAHLATHCPDIFNEAQRAIAAPAPVAMQNPPMDPRRIPGMPLPAMPSMSSQSDLKSVDILAAKMQSTLSVSPRLIDKAPPSELALPGVPPAEYDMASNADADRGPSEIDRMAVVNIEVPNAVMPPESIRDQIHFIVNNIAKANADEKSIELKNILVSEYFNWFANYLVVKRISTQPNLHSLYMIVLDMIESNPLVKTVMLSVYHNVTKLLQSPKITTSSSERSLLRNLGSWLGQMTLARNKPLLHRRINLKELVLWGYETGRLIAVCSFVAKIVEGARDSKVFRPPNPWLMALLGVMRELYELEDLKINIKFEVQVLCKNINIKIEDIPRGTALTVRRAPIKNQYNQDFTYKGPVVAPESPGKTSPLGQPVRLEDPSASMINMPSAVSSAPQSMLQGPGLMSAQVSSLQPSAAMASAVAQPQLASMGQDSGKQLYLASLSNLATYVSVSPSIQYFVTNPSHRKLVAVAVDRAIREVMQPSIERSVTIACVTTKQLVLKDYASETNEKTIISVAQLLAASLASSLSLITCKEPLRLSIGNHLRAVFAQTVTDAAVLDQIASTCANDNVELGCILIEKASTEKASRDIEGLLISELLIKRRHLESGQPLPEPAGSKPSRFPKDLPDVLKPRTGLLPLHHGVYELFQKPKSGTPQIPVHGVSGTNLIASSLPGPLPQLDPRLSTAGGASNVLSMSQALEEYEQCLLRVDNALKVVMRQAQGRDVTLAMLGPDHDIFVQLREMIIITQKIQMNVLVETALTFAESVFKRFSENLNFADTLRLEVVVGIFEALREACAGAKKFAPDLVSWLSQYTAMNAANDEQGKKVHRTVLILFLKAKLLRSAEIDVYFATYMDGGRNMVWVEIALDFIRQCLTEDIAAIFEFPKTFETVSKMRQSNVTVKKQLQKWLTDLRMLASAKEDQKSVPSNPATPLRDTTAREHVMVLIDRWLRIWTSANEALFGSYLQMMHQYGVLKTEEAADKFFRISTELCVEACLKTAQQTEAPPSVSGLNFTVVDALAKLFLLLVRLADKETGDITLRVSLLSRILNSIARCLVEDHESKKSSNGAFDQRPYHRLFAILSQDLGIPDPKHEPIIAAIPVLTTYSQIYIALQPSVVPGFAFGWLQLISHRSFMPQLLLMKGQKGWPIMHRLLIAMLMFLQPFLKHVQLTDAIRKLYKSTLRVLLVILHDFPEFLSDFHLSFCDIIPPSCVQLRNLILCAFPRSVRLPDPFTPNLKVDLLPEINQAPRILTDYAGILSERGLRHHIDTYLTTRQPTDLPVSLANILISSGNYSLPLITSLVVYIGSQAIIQQQQSKSSLQNSPAMDVFKALVNILDSEGKYHVINAMVNQLRFPNSHTHYFSCVLLVLFVDSDSELLQEQITRVLLERLIVHKPHPWGLLITFIELIKNSRYGFWQRSFTRCAPEIEKVFDSVAKSCVGAVPVQPQVSLDRTLARG